MSAPPRPRGHPNAPDTPAASPVRGTGPDDLDSSTVAALVDAAVARHPSARRPDLLRLPEPID